MSADNQVPYIVTGSGHWLLRSERRCEDLASILEAAWNVRVYELQVSMDCRDPNDIGGEWRHNSISFSLSLAGETEALLKAGLLTAEDLPAPGRKTRKCGSVQIVRRKFGYYVSCYVNPDDDRDLELRIRDAMATALWSNIWNARRQAVQP